jgi:hypothetical protein
MEFTNICPITHKKITELKNPVITPDGYTYERNDIEKWIRQNGTDPMTRNPLDISQLIVNRAVEKPTKRRKISKQPTEEKSSQKDLTIVWDISGSMLQEATYVNDTGNAENSGLSYHDIVRHAISVIINILSEKHRLSIVTFSTNATLILPLTWMNDSGKKVALNKIKDISANGCTDLWGGLYQGLQHNKHGEIYVLTDGIPSYPPPRGWEQQMLKYKSSNPDDSSVVKTFGFGYSLDSKLLHSIAHHFEGSFSFIPDAGFVGTVFIHSLVNTLIENKLKHDKETDNFITLLKNLNDLSDTVDLTCHKNIISVYKENYPHGIFEEQIDIACSRQDYYQKWGKHYLRSLYDAHFYQECNNFKDKSVQGYATPKQKELIDKADDIFCNLPPPKQSIYNIIPNNNCNNGRISPQDLSMRCFSQPSGGCFSGECRIETKHGHRKIKDLKKGDLLKTEHGYSPLICIMKTKTPNGKYNLVELYSKLNYLSDNSYKLLVTEWHPIKYQTNWEFPINIDKTRQSNIHDIPFVYSFVVENSNTVYIEGWECITLGHNVKNDPVASHDFWGTQQVIECLKQKSGWSNGEVVISEVLRNDDGEVYFLN